MHDWGNYPGDEQKSYTARKSEEVRDALQQTIDKAKQRIVKAPMPDIIYFVTWCEPKKYNVGPEQEYAWFSEEKSALAKVGECTLAGYENVAMYTFKK